jgi:hypothetical protein
MRRHASFAFLVIIAFGSTSFAAEPGETTYPIKLSRPMAPGQTFEFGGKSTINVRVSYIDEDGFMPLSYTTTVVDFDSVMTVNTVDEDRRPTKTTHAVKRCVVTEDDIVAYQLDPGAVLVVSGRGSDTVFEVDGLAVPPDVAETMSMVLLNGADGPTEDEMYGTTTKRSPGESWPMDITAYLAFHDVDKDSLPSDARLSGTIRLATAAKHRDQPCLRIAVDEECHNLLPGPGNLPPGASYERRVAKTTKETLYPEDLDRAWVSRSHHGDLQFAMNMSDLSTIQARALTDATWTMTPVGVVGKATTPDE